MNVIECRGLTKEFGSNKAINNLSFTITEGSITGLIGRNGAGKTTLLKIIAGYTLPSTGSVKVFSEDPFNSLKVSANMIFIDDNMALPESMTLTEILESAKSFYENWDHKLAMGLFKYFNFNPNRLHKNLSKGMKSTFNMILGISARCPLTIFDEPTTGMDTAVRKDFYRALLKDFIHHPRTIILSSHHVNEIKDIIGDILLIKDGEKYLHMAIDQLNEYAIGLQGKEGIIEEITRNTEVFYQKKLGKDTLYVAVRNQYSGEELQKARLSGIEISPVATEDLCVFLTAKHKRGIDDVFDTN